MTNAVYNPDHFADSGDWFGDKANAEAEVGEEEMKITDIPEYLIFKLLPFGCYIWWSNIQWRHWCRQAKKLNKTQDILRRR